MSDTSEWAPRQRWSYPASTESIAVARHDIADFVARAGLAHRVEDARLLVSELVTNAIVHARSPANVTVFATGFRIRIEVEDTSPAWPALQQPQPTDTSGRGLQIVAALAREWGVETLSTGKSVWFELDR